jgi:hypothetical protein
MQVRCPYCSTVFEATRTGVQACPNCQRQIQVPEVATVGGPPPSSPPLAPAGGGPGLGAGGGFGPGDGMPPGGPPGPGSIRGPTPWERRSEIGVIQALIDTWKSSMFSPEPFWSTVRPDGPWQDSMYYAWIIVGIGALIHVPLRSLQSSQLRRVLEQVQDSMKNIPPDAQDAINRVLENLGSASLASGIFGFIMTLIFYPVLLFIGSAILHLFCMLFGCAKNGYWATFRLSAYATSPLVFYGIPCLGFIAWIYSLVLSILGIARVQETTVGRATAAALTPGVLTCCCCCGVFGLAAGTIAQNLRR